MMIDWMTASIPLTHDKTICDGRVLSITDDGVEEWNREKFKFIEGSYSSTIKVRTNSSNELYIDGNPAKFLQGHNVFGSSDLINLNYAFFDKICSVLNLTPTDEDRRKWVSGMYYIHRIDLTVSFTLPTLDDVRAWLSAAGKSSRSNQKNSTYDGESIYFGKKSKRITTKIYSKGIEINKKGRLKSDIPFRDDLIEYSQNLLRFEVTLRSNELKRKNLHLATEWKNKKLMNEIVYERIGKIKMNQKIKLKNTEIDNLPTRLKLTYSSWINGEDLRQQLPKATYYRYRSELFKKHGIDITVPRPQKAEVIPLLSFLTAEHINELPSSFIEKGLYFEPKIQVFSRVSLRTIGNI